jgi:hypothetical protein
MLVEVADLSIAEKVVSTGALIPDVERRAERPALRFDSLCVVQRRIFDAANRSRVAAVAK